MKKIDLLTLFIIAFCIFSINLIFQQHPGYMDSEYYFLGGRQLVEGKTDLPVAWNYLDGAEQLPHPLFSYWMPLASIFSALSMFLFGSSFLGSRIIFLLFAAGLAPLTYIFSYKISQNRFISFLSGLFAIFCGYYFKFVTIPETIVPSILLGGVFFLLIGYLFENNFKNKILIFLGIISGLLYLSRSDGVLYLLLAIGSVIFSNLRNQKEKNYGQLLKNLIVLITFFTITSGWIFIYNYINFGSIFSPATSRVLWIATYDDTFIYPASQLSIQYFFDHGLTLRMEQIFTAIKQNLASFIGVQLLIVGMPLFIFGVKKHWGNLKIRVAIIHLISTFIFMSLIFPLAGSRGGFLHASAGNQIVLWFLIADGLYRFIEWGIRKRNWKLERSKKMFGSAVVGFVLLLTIVVYQKDVIGSLEDTYKWNMDYKNYDYIESFISQNSNSKSDVVMINNPVGYHYSTGRWSVVLPNADPNNLLEIMNKLDVKFVVIDDNLPNKFKNDHLVLIEKNYDLVNSDNENIKVYERP